MIKANASDSGCWIEGHWGHYSAQRLILIAESRGWNDPEASGLAHAYPECDIEKFYDAADDAETWLNENVAPEGFSFGWHDGEFFLWSVADWQEVQ